MTKFDFPERFEEAKRDILDLVNDFVDSDKNSSLGDFYLEWLKSIRDHLESLKVKDFY